MSVGQEAFVSRAGELLSVGQEAFASRAEGLLSVGQEAFVSRAGSFVGSAVKHLSEGHVCPSVLVIAGWVDWWLVDVWVMDR